ncbi:MAG: matrixin family metalloprotease [Deltaproteobacteria bacterium]
MRFSVLLAVVASVALVSEAYAFKCSRVAPDSGPSLVWQERSIPWFAEDEVFDLLGDRAIGEAEVFGAYSAWEDVECSDMALPYMGSAPALVAEYKDGEPNRNVLVVLRTGWDYDTGAIAVTTSAYDTRTGRVVDADIEINDENFDFTRVDDTCEMNAGTMDLRNTLTHEVGHVIGLEHPPNTSRYENATMFASAPPCETKKRSLESDDRDGICFIYPMGGPTAQCFPPEGPSFVIVDSDEGYGGCSHSGPARLPWASLVLLGGFIFALIRRS